MIDVEAMRMLTNYYTDVMIRVLELNEDPLYAWQVLGSPTVFKGSLDESIDYIKALRKMVRTERPTT